MSQKTPSQVCSQKGMVWDVKSVSVSTTIKGDVLIHVPPGQLATLETSDFKTFTVKLHPAT